MIQRVGRYFNLDDEGYIIPEASLQLVPPRWMPMVQEIVDFVVAQNNPHIKSIYLRGNLPRGMSTDHLSDVDLVFVISEPNVKLNKWEFEQEMLQKYSFCTDIEWVTVLAARFEQPLPNGYYPYVVNMLKTQGVLIWGKDFLSHIPRVKPGPALLANVPHFEREWKEFLDILPQRTMQRQFDMECRWMGKRILRAAFELVMLEKPAFTRDLYLCYETASARFPEIQSDLYDVLKMTVQAGAQPKDILDTFTPVAEFLLPRCKATVADLAA